VKGSVGFIPALKREAFSSILRKSEILLSMATARWTEGPNELDAREQITDFVDRLNERHEDKNFRFGIDFVLKSLLVLSDLDPGVPNRELHQRPSRGEGDVGHR